LITKLFKTENTRGEPDRKRSFPDMVFLLV
jgi:hypothetical protein